MRSFGISEIKLFCIDWWLLIDILSSRYRVDFVNSPYFFGGAYIIGTSIKSLCIWDTYLGSACTESAYIGVASIRNSHVRDVNVIKYLEIYLQSSQMLEFK